MFIKRRREDEIVADDTIETGVDSLLALLREKDKISIDEAAKILKTPSKAVQSWVDFLVEERILGLEYKWIKKYLTGELSQEDTKRTLLSEIKKYAKRQITWFKKDKNIRWVSSFNEANTLVKKFLKN